MQKIALITDSSCDLTDFDLKQHHIYMFPMRIIYSDREFLDKITLSSEAMYDSLKDEIPSTSLPDMHYCENILREIEKEGYTDVIITTVSCALSGTLNGLRLLCEGLPNLNYHFFDTKTLGYPVGVIAMEASKMIKKGMSCESIISALENVRQHVRGFIALDTLEYLKRGGRIGRVASAVGEILHLKPIISSNDEGTLYSHAKVRGRRQALKKVKEILDSYLEISPCRVWVLQGDALEEGKKFLDEVKAHPNITDISLETVGAAMGIHTGPGVVGFAILQHL